MEQKNPNLIFATRLRALYASSLYERLDLARKLGVSVQTILHWEDGDEIPNVNHLRKMADIFTLPYEFFLDELPEDMEDTKEKWQIADMLGLSEGTVERLMQLAKNAPGEVLDSTDEAIFSLLEAAKNGNREN